MRLRSTGRSDRGTPPADPRSATEHSRRTERQSTSASSQNEVTAGPPRGKRKRPASDPTTSQKRSKPEAEGPRGGSEIIGRSPRQVPLTVGTDPNADPAVLMPPPSAPLVRRAATLTAIPRPYGEMFLPATAKSIVHGQTAAQRLAQIGASSSAEWRPPPSTSYFRQTGEVVMDFQRQLVAFQQPTREAEAKFFAELPRLLSDIAGHPTNRRHPLLMKLMPLLHNERLLADKTFAALLDAVEPVCRDAQAFSPEQRSKLLDAMGALFGYYETRAAGSGQAALSALSKERFWNLVHNADRRSVEMNRMRILEGHCKLIAGFRTRLYAASSQSARKAVDESASAIDSQPLQVRARLAIDVIKRFANSGTSDLDVAERLVSLGEKAHQWQLTEGQQREIAMALQALSEVLRLRTGEHLNAGSEQQLQGIRNAYAQRIRADTPLL